MWKLHVVCHLLVLKWSGQSMGRLEVQQLLLVLHVDKLFTYIFFFQNSVITVSNYFNLEVYLLLYRDDDGWVFAADTEKSLSSPFSGLFTLFLYKLCKLFNSLASTGIFQCLCFTLKVSDWLISHSYGSYYWGWYTTVPPKGVLF